ncbi:MAG: glutaredoxin family protein [Polyangiales bacterium]
MKAPSARTSTIAGAAIALVLSSGCDELTLLVSDAVGPAEPAAQTPDQAEFDEVEVALPERPTTSTARSETDVITFRSILENDQMTRNERIRAFENLDPAALQRPVARSNVAADPSLIAAPRGSRSTEPSEADLSAARSRVSVVMYSTDWCGVCRRARQYFEQEGIPFVEHDVDRDPQARADYLLLNPRRSVPTIKIGDEVVIGFSPQAVERAMNSAARSRIN